MSNHLLTTYSLPGSGLRRGSCSCGWESSHNVTQEHIELEFSEHLNVVLKPFRVMIGDQFEDVRAESEEAAVAEVKAKIKSGAIELTLIAWENSP